MAYLDTLEAAAQPVPRPRTAASTEAAQRGEQVFEGEKAGCATLPQRARTSPTARSTTSASARRATSTRATTRRRCWASTTACCYLHDGRAKTLEEVLTGPHNPAKVTGQGELTGRGAGDLIEYLKSL